MANILLIFIAIYLIESSTASNLQIKVLSDLINSYEKPTSLLLSLCWPIHDKINLSKSINIETKQHNIQFIKDYSLLTIADFDVQNALIVLQSDCLSSIKLIQHASELLFRAPVRWIVFNNDEMQIPKMFDNLTSVGPDTEITLIKMLSGNQYRLQMVYKNYPEGEWIIENYGTWNETNGIALNGNFIMETAVRRVNLNGAIIQISYVVTNNDSINHLEDYFDDHIDTITKVSFPITNQLLDYVNANRVYMFTNTWGYNINGSWTGMIGQMTRGQAEIGGSPMFFTSDRISVIEFISSPTPTRSKFVFRQPKLSYENNLFVLPFRDNVWYCCSGILLLVLIVLFLVTAWEWKHPTYIKLEREHDASILRAKLSDISIFVVGVACQQGNPVELKGSLGRVVTYILLLSFMFLYTSYSANIVALLQSSSSNIKTLNDLLHSRLRLGVDDTVFNHYYFPTATEPVRAALYKKKIAVPGTKPNFMDLKEGVINMRKGLFAFHMETGVGYKIVNKLFQEDEKCGLEEIQFIQVMDPFMAIKRNTPYRKMFKIGMRRVQEFGLTSRENSLMYAKKPRCTGHGNSFISVSLVDCYPTLVILSYGILIALFILIIEILHKKRQEIILRIQKKCFSSVNQ